MRVLRSACAWTALAIAFAILFSSATASAQACPLSKSGRKYKVKIESTPAGATVYLGGKECGAAGTTPWSGKLAAGEVSIVLEYAGYANTNKTMKVVRSRKLQAVFLPMSKQPKIDVVVTADKNVYDASVWVDGNNQGKAPVAINTTAGRHLVEIKKDGFDTYQQWVDTSDGTVTVAAVLNSKAKFGAVVVESDVPDADVYIDGNKHPDKTPTVIQSVAEGMHVVEVRKEPAVPWKQTVQVVANQQVKVSAQLKASLGGGSIRVLSNVDKAHVFLDGKDMGAVPIDIKDVKTGDHVIEVKAPGYQTREEKVAITSGQSAVFKLDLNVSGDGIIKVVSPTPGAEVFIDGASAGRVPAEKGVSTGEHFVVVKVPGHKDFEQKVRIDAGQTVTVSAEPKSVGRLRILSQPQGAQVTINGQIAGNTPLETDVELGDAVVRVESPGFRAQERTIAINGGKTETISLELEEAGPTPEESQAEQRGLSHFGARTLARGRSTVSADAGYPYYGTIRINVGAGRVGKQFGFDAGVGARTFLARNEIGLGVRFTLYDRDPFSLGVFGDLWWGSRLLDDSKRNGVTFDTGIMGSLTALTHVTITGRAYASMWSDRHCPEIKMVGGTPTLDGDPTDSCEKYFNLVIMNQPDPGFQEDRARMESLTGQEQRDMFTREQGVRFYIGVVAELAIQQRWSIYGILEGAPFQDERALFTHLFSGPMFSTDYGTYLRLGLTYKF